MNSAASVVRATSYQDVIVSDIFGPVEFSDDQLLLFANGIPGFPECAKWILIQGEKPGTAWLQSIDLGALTFLLVDPFVFFEGFSIEFSPSDLRMLGADDASALTVFAIVTFPATRDEPVTANLQGPIVINPASCRAAQMVMSEGPWTVRHAFHFSAAAERQ